MNPSGLFVHPPVRKSSLNQPPAPGDDCLTAPSPPPVPSTPGARRRRQGPPSARPASRPSTRPRHTAPHAATSWYRTVAVTAGTTAGTTSSAAWRRWQRKAAPLVVLHFHVCGGVRSASKSTAPTSKRSHVYWCTPYHIPTRKHMRYIFLLHLPHHDCQSLQQSLAPGNCWIAAWILLSANVYCRVSARKAAASTLTGDWRSPPGRECCCLREPTPQRSLDWDSRRHRTWALAAGASRCHPCCPGRPHHPH